MAEYNPYGGVPEQGGSFISDLINPTNIIAWHMANPMNFSMSKGFRIPFAGMTGALTNKAGRTALTSAYKEAFKSKGIVGKVYKTLGVTTQLVGWGKVSGQKYEYWAGTKMLAANKTYNQFQDAIYNSLIKKGMKGSVADREASSLAKGYLTQKSVRRNLGVYKKSSSSTTDAIRNFRSGKIPNSAIPNISSLHEGVQNIGVQNLRSINKVGLWRATTGVNLLKASMFVGKAASIVGLLSIGWSITQAIGEPIGRGLIESSNAALNTWRERFMPELGGKLSVAYLSRSAATERQRSIEAISKAYINGRSAFGQEASYMH